MVKPKRHPPIRIINLKINRGYICFIIKEVGINKNVLNQNLSFKKLFDLVNAKKTPEIQSAYYFQKVFILVFRINDVVTI